MCGIHVAISRRGTEPLQPILEQRLRNRGPDHLGIVQKSCSGLCLSFTSTVLSLRGDHVAQQPLVDETSAFVLCWNGEAWATGGKPVEGNDGEMILALLRRASRERLATRSEAVLDVLRTVEGPFAFAYYDELGKRLYYGRDRLGRRSLLVKSGMPFVLSSVAEESSAEWAEVEADGCYTIDLDQDDLTPVRHDWSLDDTMIAGIEHFNSTLPDVAAALSRTSQSVIELDQYLQSSMRPRVLEIPLPPGASETDSRMAVLFSGGLDCTVLVRLASNLLPSSQTIDLLNVAFENPRIASQHKGISQDDLYEMCPDRITGRNSFAELAKVCPDRAWRLVTVNVPYAETCAHRDEIVSLIYPHNTEMDLSIANALYFAARGHGLAIMNNEPEPLPYQTTARVLLSGLGADELFGGYVRHSTAYSRRGYEGLIEELKLDVSRLGKRNLGRDDRVFANWGREVRFPFLDESLVRWAMGLPAWEKCDFHTPIAKTGLDPEKRVLRLLAQNLGMGSVAEEKKRAIQFGARTAKMESGRVKGTTSISR